MDVILQGACALPDMDLPHIPDYELLTEIGGNSLTRTFSARHRAGGFACVVKTPRDGLATDGEAQRAILREARIGLAVRHRHVIRLFDAQVHMRPYYVIMECLDGESLQVRLRREPLGVDQSLRVAWQIADGLMALHQLGFVHGAVQTSHVVIARDGTAVLTELGCAHRPGEPFALSGNHADYVAPELNDGGHTFASDWYSFGITVGELLNGEVPGTVGYSRDILKYRQRSAMESWSLQRSIVWPVQLTELLARLTDENPRQRPIGTHIVEQLQELELREACLTRAA